MDIQSARHYMRQQLNENSNANESDYLLSHILGKDRAWLYTHTEYQLNHTQKSQLQELITKRNTGIPLAYLRGYQEFYGLDFFVNELVLIPRPETEIAVEYTIATMPQNARLLDLGTGCGNIAVAIAYHRPDLAITATDISSAALDIAKRNAQHHHCDITFVQSDWYQSINDQFDWIISNPPYIAHHDPDAEHQAIAVEPHIALYAEDGGTAGLSAVIKDARKHLNKHGKLLVEHGYKQAAVVAKLMHTAGFNKLYCLKDATQHPRFAVTQ